MDYKKLGTSIFLSLAGAIAFFFLLFRIQAIAGLAAALFSTVRPILLGAAAAYLLCPAAAWLERLLGRAGRLRRAARPLSVLLAAALAFAAVTALTATVVPQLGESVAGLSEDLPDMVNTQTAKLQSWLGAHGEAADNIGQMLESAEENLAAWVKDNLLRTVSGLAGRVMSIGSAVVSLFVAVIAAVYLLLDRERYLAQCRKLFHAVVRNERACRITAETVEKTHQLFSGFITGKLLDSLIVGVLCFLFLLITRMPYALLISVIVGVTNIIPMFGPFIGAIPSAFLLLLVSPRNCLVFLIFIVILQQLDGNVIGPRILGDSTGLSALYVTIATLVFGKLLGFLGMMIGVPLFATLYYLVKRAAEYSLRRQGLPVRTEDYHPGKRVRRKPPKEKK